MTEDTANPATRTVRRYRKRPVEVEAVELTWGTWSEVCEFVGEDRGFQGVWVHPTNSLIFSTGDPLRGVPLGQQRMGLLIHTLEGDMLAIEGDMIVKGVKGEVYPVKPDIFAETYTLVP